MKPSLVGQFKDQFKTAVTEKGGADKKPAGTAVFFGGPLTAAEVTGDTASASFDTTTTSGAPAKVTMMLVRTQRTWRITGFKNPEVLMGD